MANDDRMQLIVDYLDQKIAEHRRKLSSLIDAMNTVRAEDGLPPIANNNLEEVAEHTVSRIQPDTFFGQKQHSAMVKYLTMRKTTGLGPASTDEIYSALVAGGFRYEASSKENAIIGMRQLLRRNTGVFVTLPNNTFGLRAWYPELRKPKTAPGVAEPASNGNGDSAHVGEVVAQAGWDEPGPQ